MRNFAKDPKGEISGDQRFRSREASHPCYYAPRGSDSSYSGLLSIFGHENGDFRFQPDDSSPTRTKFHLGEGMKLLLEVWFFA